MVILVPEMVSRMAAEHAKFQDEEYASVPEEASKGEDEGPPPRDHVLLSGRFTTDNPKIKNYMAKVQRELNALGIATFMVNTKRDFGAETMRGLGGARCMVAFCNSSYGEKTSDTYETYCELKHAYENHEIDLIPVQLCTKWPPQPPGQAGKDLCTFVLGKSKVKIKGLESDDTYKAAHKLAADIRDHIKGLGVLDQVGREPPLAAVQENE
ncbi:unnamed protein product [Symbiodinium natans]|uniref:TIR domain-containing protein n=1 Tax=Symbiodinium natans TaxID=878477 RepID=A0A812I3U7_9DINO|nr:unnamed protein product [Symbiodinium natans]